MCLKGLYALCENENEPLCLKQAGKAESQAACSRYILHLPLIL